MISTNLVVGKKYSFYTLAPAILGSRFENLTLNGIVNYEIAKTIRNIQDTQRQVYPILPEGTSDKFQNYNYLLFSTIENGILVLAEEWIDKNSIQTDFTIIANIEIRNVTATQIPLLRDILTTNGFNSFSITTSNTYSDT